MHIDGPPESAADLVAAARDRLTPTERRIAEAVLAEPTLLVFGTVSALAERVGTSRPTIVRFAVKLGFEGYSDLQVHIRRGMSRELSRPSQRIRQTEISPTESARESMERALARVFDGMDSNVLDIVVSRLASAEHVWVVSGETSRAGAHALVSGLSIIRGGVRLLEPHSVGVTLAESSSRDVAVVLDFRRYRTEAIRTAQILAERGVSIVAITDGPLSPLAPLTDTRIDLEVPAVGPFDSSVPAVATAELLVALVATQLHDEATERIDRTEQMWEETKTFMADPG
ncbi:MAG: MurR/RpiR family transcriptional regulator [Acidimicrobiia bacterium]